MRKKLLVLAIQSVLFGGLMNLSVPIQAAEQQTKESTNDATDSEQKEVVEVLVTGSRIKRDSFSTSTPLVTVNREAIEDSGLGSLSEILIEETPAISESTSNLNSQSSVQNTGLSTVNLRNLGTDRTLTLIDGRRVVSNSYSGNYVSLSTIPSGMVDRIEIISGGASAVYGSDAIAGVVNIITQKDKEGFEFKSRVGKTPEGGGEEFSLDLSYGAAFDDGRGYFFISSAWDRQFGIKWHHRDRAKIESSFDYNTRLLCNEMNTIDGDQCIRDITQADWRERSDGTAGGVFEEGRRGVGGFYYNQNGLQTGWLEERDGVNTEIWDNIKIPNDALAIAFKLDYDLTDTTQATFQVQYSENNSKNVKSPEDESESSDVLFIDSVTGAPGEIRPGTISINNPFAPALIADNAGSSISWDRRFHEVGNVITDNERTTIRSWAGLKGSIFEDKWDWELSLGYGQFKQRQHRLNELNTFRVNQALNSEYAADGVTIQCADADARAAGCVPLNIFGIGSITPEAADWIRANPTIFTDIEQITFSGFVAGDLFEMPAGNVSSAFGFEYRKDTQDLNTSAGHQFGGITFNVVPTFKGEIDVSEVFAELSIPLATNLTADTSLRLADYSLPGIDLMSSYKLGFAWQPSKDYLVRANYARAQRAPSITEALSPPRGDFDSFNDICEEVTATSTGAGHDNCRLEPGIAATIAAEGIFEDANNGYSPNTGNANLKEETADTYTFGITMSPSFIEGLNLAIDYYGIKVTDAIGQIGNSDILRNCYDSSVAFGTENSFCNDIRRDADGQIIEVLQREFNLNELTTRGYDVALQYSYPTESYGKFTFRTDLTHVIEHSITFTGNDGIEKVNFAGSLDDGIFKDKASASMIWNYNNWRVRWKTKYKGPVVDSFERVEQFEELFAENQLLIDAGDPDAILNPEVPNYLFYGSYIKHSLSISYDVELQQSGTQLRVFGGINNIFNNQGPFIPNTGDNFERGVGNFDSKYGGGIGRFLYLGFELSI